jgi:adenylate kinase
MMMSQPTLDNVLFFPFIAPPNGGKGTQTSRLADLYDMPRIDMGSMLRVVAKDDTPLAHRVKETLAAGKLVNIETVIDVLKAGIQKQLDARDASSNKIAFILDGFPRNAEQTTALLEMCASTGAEIGAAIYLDVPYDVIAERAINRRICGDCGQIYNLKSQAPQVEGVCDNCGGTHLEHRVDDQPEKVTVRLEGFDADTLPILAAFEKQGNLHRVDGNRSVDDVTESLKTLMNTVLKREQTV